MLARLRGYMSWLHQMLFFSRGVSSVYQDLILFMMRNRPYETFTAPELQARLSADDLSGVHEALYFLVRDGDVIHYDTPTGARYGLAKGYDAA